MNNVCFTQCILQVLRKQSGVRNESDHDTALAVFWQEKGSRHLYIFRHTDLLHEDGSLSLIELLNHAETARKIRAMYRDGYQALNQIDVAAVPAPLRGKNNTIRFLMSLAHVVCDANKFRAMIGFLTQDNFEPGKIPEPDTWFKPADFSDDQARQQAFLSDLRADIPITSPLHILHSVLTCILSGTLCTAQTRKTCRLSGVSDSFPEEPEEDGIMFISLLIAY